MAGFLASRIAYKEASIARNAKWLAERMTNLAARVENHEYVNFDEAGSLAKSIDTECTELVTLREVRKGLYGE